MRLFLLGATGPTGQQLVNEALAQNHEIVAVVRNPEKLTTQSEHLKVVKGNVFEASELTEHMKGCDAVLSTLGAQGGMYTPCDVYTKSSEAVVTSMRSVGIKRFVALTAWGTKDDPSLPFFWRWILKPLFLRNLVKDMELFEDTLLSDCSDISYTIVRPPRLTDNPSTGSRILAHIGQLVPGAKNGISRQDVAKFMLQTLNTDEYDRKFVAIAGTDAP
uniref:NAD(P)-binding domain-containing protein n=1 Tax=Arion vulgaris TaxID=1028688 RepID=A0A0B7AQ05_9EUPU